MGRGGVIRSLTGKLPGNTLSFCKIPDQFLKKENVNLGNFGLNREKKIAITRVLFYNTKKGKRKKEKFEN